ncbi:MAG: hypothetical protein IPN17_18600 [Deltaproteobacteria bacterium]|nr:hypothetical protein [Deltaproteobacteria bacterium]
MARTLPATSRPGAAESAEAAAAVGAADVGDARRPTPVRAWRVVPLSLLAS